jgi:outer membrane protein assembly factor BamA
MVVRVEEVEAREVAFLAGYGSYEKARGAIILSDRNLFGLGQRLRLVGRASTKSWGTDATWTEPELLGTRTDLSVTTFLTEREEPAFTDFSWGTSTALSRRLLSYTQARVGYSFQERDASEVDPSVAATVNNDVTIGEVFTELIRDDRDSQIYPTSGHREVVRFEVASDALGGDVDFLRLTARADWHHELWWERWVLSLGAEGGWIWPGAEEPLPVQERFYNGGQSTVRSFREGKLGPLTPEGSPAGGEFRNVFNAELRFPIFRALEGAVFADAGNVGSEVEEYGLADLRYAVGGGLRLVLPIGPVRFDVGWNPHPEPEERNYTMHLAVGLPF